MLLQVSWSQGRNLFFYFKKENPGCSRENTKEEEAWAQGKLLPETLPWEGDFIFSLATM